MRCVLTLDRQSSMFCACVRWSVDVNRMERVDLTKKGYMMLVFSVRKKKLHAKQTDATRTDRLSEAITRPGRYPSRIQGTSQGRFCIHFIDVLFRPSHHLVDTAQPNKKKGRDGGQTWPPGPELREKARSTAALGIGHLLNRISQSRAAAASFEVSRMERGGGAGSDESPLLDVLCRAVRTSS
jgi:hypothetical protein